MTSLAALATAAEVPDGATFADAGMMPHQIRGIEFLRGHERALLADDPGLGKTAQLLFAAAEPVLVVAPAMLRGTWEREVERWTPGLDVTWVSYSSLCRRVGRKVFASPREEYEKPWGTVVFDEAHYLKNRKAKWTQAALLTTRRAERVYLATGTPVPNWAHELFMLAKLLHPGDTRYRSYWRWIDEWFSWWTPPYGGAGHREVVGLKDGISWREFAAGNDLDTLMLRRLREEVLRDLPPLTETTIEVPMAEAQRKAYDELKADYYTFVEEAGSEVAAFSDGGLHVKLAKATTGLPTLAGDPEIAGSCKLEALRELLTEREGSPVVVFCHFRDTAEAVRHLCHELKRAVAVVMGGIDQLERDDAVACFQDGAIDVIVGTLATLAEGVTLTRSHTAVFVERSWRPSRNEQAMRRLHRIGQDSPVTVIHITTADSLDERMTQLLAAKEAQQVGVLRAAQFAAML